MSCWSPSTTFIERISMGYKVAAIVPGKAKRFPIHESFDFSLRLFAEGGKHHVEPPKWDGTDKTLICRGVSQKIDRVIAYCKEYNIDYIHIDTGYFGNVKRKIIHRVSRNAMQTSGPILRRKLDRATAQGYEFCKFTPGEKILICPPSRKIMRMFGQPPPEEWVESIIEEIKKYTDRPIEVRLKPSRRDRTNSKSITAALDDNVHCLVTYNSIAATEALMHGKPAIVLGPHNAAEVIAERNIANIENPFIPSEKQMNNYVAHLSYCQFTVSEMKDGTAWKIMNPIISSKPLSS